MPGTNRLLHFCFALSLVLWGGCKDDSKPRPGPKLPNNQQPSTNTIGSEPAAVVTNITTGTAGGELTLPLIGEPRTYNPLAASDRSSETITRLLFAGLTRFNWQTETPEPDLAHKWSVSADGKTWTWHLRKNLQWSDGQALTADDVVFTWNDIIYNPHFINPLADTFSIEGKKFAVSKIDKTTVQFVTPEPFAPFVAFVGTVPIIPRHAVRGYIRERRFTEFYRLGTLAFRLVGSGPYRLKEHMPGEGILLERNQLYHRSDESGNRLPYIDLVRFRAVPAADDLPHRFLTNGFALAEGIRFEDLQSLTAANKTNEHQILDLGPGSEPRIMWFNQNTNAPGVAPHKQAWFRDSRFRQAVNLAIDREAIIESVYDGKGGLPDGFLVAGSERWRVDSGGFPHDVARSMKLLEEIGFQKNDKGRRVDAKGNALSFTLKLARGSRTSSAVAETIRTQLETLGIHVTVAHVEFPALLHSLDTEFDYDAILMGFGGGVPDPQTARDILRSDGPMHYWHPRQSAPVTKWERQIDELFTRQRGELDFEKRKRTCAEISSILSRELPYLPLLIRHKHAVVRTKLGNLKPVAASPFPLTWNLEELFLQ